MSRWRVAVLATLWLAPLVAFVVAGAWALWETGWLRWTWWLSSAVVMVLCGLPYPFVRSSEAGASLSSLLATSADTAALLIAFGFVLAVAWRVSAPRRTVPV